MSGSKTQFSGFYYNKDDYTYLSQYLDFKDANTDGHFESLEADSDFQSFYKELSQTQRERLQNANAKNPLSQSQFAFDSVLRSIAQKAIQHKEQVFYEDNGLPKTLDTALFDVATKYPLDQFKPEASFFNSITIDDTTGLLLKILTEADLSHLPTPTLAVLKDLLLNHQIQSTSSQDSKAFQLTFDSWQEAFDHWHHPAKPMYSASSTWQEILLIWQNSHHFEWQNALHGKRTNWQDEIIGDDTPTEKTVSGLLLAANVTDSPLRIFRLARKDKTITDDGIKDYLAHPKKYTQTPTFNDSTKSQPESLIGLDNVNLRMDNSWPAHIGRFTIPTDKGVDINADVDPGAKVIVNQSIKKGNFNFQASEPLLYFQGIHINLDANTWWSKILAAMGQSLTQSLLHKNFDGQIYITGITVFQNRFCFILQGENPWSQNITPIDNDFFLLDINPLIQNLLKQKDPTGAASKHFFNKRGDLYSNLSFAELQKTLTEVFQTDLTTPTTTNSFDTPQNRAQAKKINSEIWANDIQMDLSPLVKQIVPESDSIRVTNLSIKDGDLYAKRNPQNSEFFAQGAFDINLGLANPKSDQVDITKAHLEFYFDATKSNCSGKYAGYARLSIPEIKIPGSAQKYGGTFFVGLQISDFESLIATGDIKGMINAITAQVLIDVQKDGQDYLAASLYGYATREIKTYQSLNEILQSYQIDYKAVLDDGNPAHLAAVVKGNVVFGIDQCDDNPTDDYLGISVTADNIMIGGITRLFAKDTTLAIYKSSDGSIHIIPHNTEMQDEHQIINEKEDKTKTITQTKINTKNFDGEIVITPIRDEDSGVVSQHKVEINNLRVNIADAEIATELAILRGSIKEARLNGSFSVLSDSSDEESGLGDMLNIDKWYFDKENQDNLKLTLVKSQMNAFDPLTGDAFGRVDLDEFSGGVFDVSYISAKPSFNGTVGAQAQGGRFAYEDDILAISGDWHSNAQFKGPILPDVRFETPQVANNLIPNKDVVLLKHPMTKAQEELVKQIETETKSTQGDDSSSTAFDEEILKKEALESFDQFANLIRSIENGKISVDQLLLLPNADYNKTNKKGEAYTHLFAIQGFWKFLQFMAPRVFAGTMINKNTVDIQIEDSHLVKARAGVTHPIPFLGMQFTGIEISKPKSIFKGKEAKSAFHLYLTSKHYRIDITWLLQLVQKEKMNAYSQGLQDQLEARYLDADIKDYIQQYVQDYYQIPDFLTQATLEDFKKNYAQYGLDEKKKGLCKKEIPAEQRDLFNFIKNRYRERFSEEFDLPLRAQFVDEYHKPIRLEFAEDYKQYYTIQKLVEDYRADQKLKTGREPDVSLCGQFLGEYLKNGLYPEKIPPKLSDIYTFVQNCLSLLKYYSDPTLDQKDIRPVVAQEYAYVKHSFDTNLNRYFFKQSLIDSYTKRSPGLFDDVPPEIADLTQFVEQRVVFHDAKPENKKALTAFIKEKTKEYYRDHSGRWYEHEVFIAKRFYTHYRDYQLKRYEVPNEVGDLASAAHELATTFLTTDSAEEKKPPLIVMPKDPIGINNQSAIHADLEFRLKPFHATLGKTHIAVWEENSQSATASLDYLFNREAESGGNSPYIQFDLANQPEESIENIHIDSRGLAGGSTKFSANMLLANGFHLVFDGDPKKTAPTLTVERMVAGGLFGSYTPPTLSGLELIELPHDDALNPNRIIVRDFATTQKEEANGDVYDDIRGKTHGIISAEAFIFKQVDADTGKIRRGAINLSGFTLGTTEFHIESARYRKGEFNSAISKGVSLVSITSNDVSQVYNPLLKDGEPWVTLQIGEVKGKPQYFFLDQFSIYKGKVKIGDEKLMQPNENVPMSYAGDIVIHGSIPAMFDPILEKFHQAGITANISDMKIGGTLEFTLNGSQAKIAQITREDGTFQPISITLEGDIIIRKGGINITLHDLTIPLEQLMLELSDKEESNEEGHSAGLKSVALPLGGEITAGVEGSITVPKTGRGVYFKHGSQLTVGAANAIHFGMADASDPTTLELPEEGIQDLRARVEGGENVIDFHAGRIYFKNGEGKIDYVEISASLVDYAYKEFKMVLQPLIRFENVKVKLKKKANPSAAKLP